MSDIYTGVIEGLERRKASIERALAALREVDAPDTVSKVKPDGLTEAPSGSRRKFTAAARKRMALAQKARWAKIKGKSKGETQSSAAPAPEPAAPKRRISPEGIKRIVAATKKRWRLQREAAKLAQSANAAAKKVAARKVVARKAVAKKAVAKNVVAEKVVAEKVVAKKAAAATAADSAPPPQVEV